MVVLNVDGQEIKKSLKIEGDPNFPNAIFTTEEEEQEFDDYIKTERRKTPGTQE